MCRDTAEKPPFVSAHSAKIALDAKTKKKGTYSSLGNSTLRPSLSQFFHAKTK